MRYIVLFAVIVLIMVAVNVFMFLMLRSLKNQLGNQLGSCLIHQMKFADDLCEEKMERLRKLREEEESYLGHTTVPGRSKTEEPLGAENVSFAGETRAASPVSKSGLPGKATYVNRNLMKEYRYIKEHFHVDTKRAVDTVLTQQPDKAGAGYSALCASMYDRLTDDLVYKLGLLPEKEQLDIILESFGPECREILSGLMAREKHMDAAKLREILRSESELWKDEVVVHTPEPEQFESVKGITVVKDDTVGEGAKIFRGSKMYDYSL